MKHIYLSLLSTLISVLCALPCHAVRTIPEMELAKSFEPILKRDKNLIHLLSMGGEIEIWYYHPDIDNDHKLLGPADNGFVLQAEAIDDLSKFKPSQHPFDWKGYPEKEHYPWSAEFHLLPLGRSAWMVVSVWCGKTANRDLVRELLVTASKSTDETGKYLNDRYHEDNR